MDLANTEKSQADIIATYLPEPYSEKELETLIDDLISQMNIVSKSDMGKLMSAVLQKANGRANGSVISKIVNKKLI